MTGPLDRAARALEVAYTRWTVRRQTGHGEWVVFDTVTRADVFNAGNREDCYGWIDRERVRAVLAALDPPSEAMQTAGHLVRTRHLLGPTQQPYAGTDEIWTAMLAAAREGA